MSKLTLRGDVKVFSLLKRRKETEKEKAFKFHKSIAIEEIEKAKKELVVAEYHFNHCESKFFDIANAQLSVARQKLDVAVMKAKLLKVQ